MTSNYSKKKKKKKKKRSHPLFEAVGEAGVVAPRQPLIVGEAAGALRLEVEEALREGVAVVGGSIGERKRGEEGKN